MSTRSKNELRLFDKCAPIFDSAENHDFAGAYPPTLMQAILQYHGYHQFLQKNSGLQSSTAGAVNLVVQNVQKWWLKTGISTKTDPAICKMIDKKVSEYKLLKKSKYKTSKPAITRRSTFLSKLQETFWVVQPNVEKRLKDMHAASKLKNKDDSKDLEDYLYLEGVLELSEQQHLALEMSNLLKGNNVPLEPTKPLLLNEQSPVQS